MLNLQQLALLFVIILGMARVPAEFKVFAKGVARLSTEALKTGYPNISNFQRRLETGKSAQLSAKRNNNTHDSD